MANIFTKIIKDIESEASKFEDVFKKLFGEAPTWLTIASNFVGYAAPIITTIATLAGGPLVGTETGNILAAIKVDLATALATVNAVDAATSVPTLLKGVQSQLPALLAAVKIENPAIVSKVETYTTLISGEIDALLASLPVPVAAA